MKSFKLFSWAILAAITLSVFTSCSSDDDDNSDDIISVKGDIGDGSSTFEIKKDTTFAKGIYRLRGFVYVTSGVTVKFEAGSIIKGEKATKGSLIIEPGAKIFAQGTPTSPIVFTSEAPKGQRKPGDWGGLIICGKAKNNLGTMTIEGGPRTVHGGNDDSDNSGVLSYVRVEFAGYPYLEDKEINGITFGSVGSGTKIDHVQVSYSNDDSFEWFGGTVNAKNLVAYHGWDDDFDTDNGFSGKLQFILGVRNPKIADTSLSNGFESDNNSDGSTATPKTAAVFSNVTLVGPIGQASDFVNTKEYITAGDLYPNNNSKTGLFQSAMQIRRYSQLNCFNSVAMGYPVGLLLDNQKGNTQSLATSGALKLNNLIFAQMGVVGADVNNLFKDKYSTNGKDTTSVQSFSHTFFLQASNNNKYYPNISDLKLKQPNSMLSGANWGPTTGSPLLTAGAFTDALVKDSFFTAVSYAGAFSSDNDSWMAGWTNFDPQNADY